MSRAAAPPVHERGAVHILFFDSDRMIYEASLEPVPHFRLSSRAHNSSIRAAPREKICGTRPDLSAVQGARTPGRSRRHHSGASGKARRSWADGFGSSPRLPGVSRVAGATEWPTGSPDPPSFSSGEERTAGGRHLAPVWLDRQRSVCGHYHGGRWSHNWIACEDST